MHVFQMLNRVLPEADAAMADADRFIRSVVADLPAGDAEDGPGTGTGTGTGSGSGSGSEAA
jgi:hypothetical protein